MGTSFAYDAWGRMTSKTRGSYSAGYAWGEGDKLTGVASNFPGEGSVTYAYGGDGKRRERNDGTLTKYRWDRGWNVLHEENGSGGLTLSLVPHRADIAGSNPATGTIRYTLRDHLGSLRALYAPDKTRLGRQEYTPYGSDYLQTGARATRAYTGHDRDAATGLYFAPYRYYSPDLARWLSRDPLGMVDGPNIYIYALGNPIGKRDRLGLTCTIVFFPDGTHSQCLEEYWFWDRWDAEKCVKNYLIAQARCYGPQDGCISPGDKPKCLEKARAKYYDCIMDALDL